MQRCCCISTRFNLTMCEFREICHLRFAVLQTTDQTIHTDFLLFLRKFLSLCLLLVASHFLNWFRLYSIALWTALNATCPVSLAHIAFWWRVYCLVFNIAVSNIDAELHTYFTYALLAAVLCSARWMHLHFSVSHFVYSRTLLFHFYCCLLENISWHIPHSAIYVCTMCIRHYSCAVRNGMRRQK